MKSNKLSKNLSFVGWEVVDVVEKTIWRGEEVAREMISLEELEQSEALRTITIPLVVPSEQEVIDNANLDLSVSPLNACYSKPAINEKTGKRQSWRDVKLTIEGEENLPSKKDWFYLVTDNGFWCKACFRRIRGGEKKF